MKNTGGSLNTASEVQLFRLYDEGGTQQDLSETKNVASDYPEIAAQMLADLNRWLENHNGSVAVRKRG